MSYKLFIYDERLWKKDCNKIPKKDLERIFGRIKSLEKDPWPKEVQIKQLHDFDVADFRLRVGSFRVLFNKDESSKTVYLLRVLHRSKLY